MLTQGELGDHVSLQILGRAQSGIPQKVVGAGAAQLKVNSVRLQQSLLHTAVEVILPPPNHGLVGSRGEVAGQIVGGLDVVHLHHGIPVGGGFGDLHGVATLVQHIDHDIHDGAGAVSVGIEIQGVGYVGGHALVAVHGRQSGLGKTVVLGQSLGLGVRHSLGSRAGGIGLGVSLRRAGGKDRQPGQQAGKQKGNDGQVFHFHGKFSFQKGLLYKTPKTAKSYRICEKSLENSDWGL